jgi:hypothetical protein
MKMNCPNGRGRGGLLGIGAALACALAVSACGSGPGEKASEMTSFSANSTAYRSDAACQRFH